MAVIVARISADHPSGQYIAEGYKFLPTFQVVNDSEEIIARLEADEKLIKAPFGSRNWCEAQGIPFTEDELRKLGLDINGKPLAGAPEASPASAAVAEKEGSQEAPPTVSGQQNANAEKSDLTKKEIVSQLEAKGLVDGKDFDSRAKKDDLAALL